MPPALEGRIFLAITEMDRVGFVCAAPVGRGMTDAATALPRFGVHSVAEKGVERVRNPVIVCGWATRRGAPH